MSESEEEQSGIEEEIAVEDPVRVLLEGWGLRAGRMASGWRLDQVSLDLHRAAACIDFSRDTDSVRVRAMPAGDDPCFKRVGAIAISHDKVDDLLNEDVGQLLTLLAEWFKQRADNDALAALLESANAEREEREAAEQAQPDPEPEEQEFGGHLEQSGGPTVDDASADGDQGSQPYIHYENGTTKYESMNQLLPHLDVETIMSFYVPVQLPDSGGILEVYTTDCSGDGDRIIADLGGPDRARSILAERGCIEVLPEIGDMLVFDGGRYYHVVTEIEGPRARWTLGGFFAYTKDHNRVLYWS